MVKSLPDRSSRRATRDPDRRRPAGARGLSTARRCASGVISAAALTLLLAGCGRGRDAPSVAVYTSVDQEFAEPLLLAFSEETGIRVDAAYDTEAGKTSGFLRRIQREAQRPRCDVWWSSEVFGTVELANAGLLAAYDSPAAGDIPREWRDAQRRWTGLAPRARVLAFHPARVARERLPRSWKELADNPLPPRLALANPLFGTTRGHVGAIFAAWGDDAGRALLRKLRAGHATIADGNAQAVRLLAAGAADVCLTDTDDVWAAQARGEAIDLLYLPLDQAHGPLWIPNSVALVQGAPHPEPARRLIDYLVGAATERALARSASRNVPVRPALRSELEIAETPVAPDFEGVARRLPAALEAARELLID